MSQEKELKRIADAFEKILKIYEDPEAYLEGLTQRIGDTMQRLNITPPQLPIQGQPVEGGQAVAQITGAKVEVLLSAEERKAICEQAMADIEAQMTEFKGFIGQALSELPEGQLKRLGELMKKGEKFKLRRRHGCIYMDFGHGDDDFYLRM